MRCPKCGIADQYENDRGPVLPGNKVRFVKDEKGEYLKETCHNCGYEMSKPCKDAPPEKIRTERLIS